jgi:hypothetical protein
MRLCPGRDWGVYHQDTKAQSPSDQILFSFCRMRQSSSLTPSVFISVHPWLKLSSLKIGHCHRSAAVSETSRSNVADQSAWQFSGLAYIGRCCGWLSAQPRSVILGSKRFGFAVARASVA